LWNDRHQLWAEAVSRYRDKESWWIDDSELEKAAKAEQAKRQETDAWDDVIITYLAAIKKELALKALTAEAYAKNPKTDPKILAAAIAAANTGVTTGELLTGPLGKRVGDIENRDQKRVGSILRRLGWQRRQIGAGAMRGKTHYLPPPDAADEPVV
jgi:predicted P-loop ATPase